jgi:hypothetical protein
MFEGNFGEKCIMMHFWGAEKEKKSVERRGAEKDLRRSEDRKPSKQADPGPPESSSYQVGFP